MVYSLMHYFYSAGRRLCISVICISTLMGCSLTAPQAVNPTENDPKPKVEQCDRMDNDRDLLVDEDFKNEQGEYVDDDHCGRCNHPCVPDDMTQSVACITGEFGPSCVATSCKKGFVKTGGPTCVPWDAWLCGLCREHSDCGPFDEARCNIMSGEGRCTTLCIDGECPDEYECKEGLCLPASGTCQCGDGDYFTFACTIDVAGTACLGQAVCNNGTISPCRGSVEVCDHIDNDCNGITDDPFVDELGLYRTDIHHCGTCGVDCTLNQAEDLEVVCGGPPTMPRCSLKCEDADDGIQIGDHFDADLDPENGCECPLVSFEDHPGIDNPEQPEIIDTNCDGADGVIQNSIYVHPGGDADSTGTPIDPMPSINAAIAAAKTSLSTTRPQPNILIAAGIYSEVIHVENGIHLYGGYRPDFLERNPDGFTTEIHAPNWDGSPGGAALTADRDSAPDTTIIDGLTFRGASAQNTGAYAVAAYLDDPGNGLTLQNLTLIAGDGADGQNGSNGILGASPPGNAEAGEKPKIAIEDDYNCDMSNPLNINKGGEPDRFECDQLETSGGKGGDAQCGNSIDTSQPSGTWPGNVGNAKGGNGGSGGSDVVGPIDETHCGLADFIVGNYDSAHHGEPGSNGDPGLGGNGCIDPLGQIVKFDWIASPADAGSQGNPGAGGGGGGAGGSVVMTGRLSNTDCIFPDGIGGGGGGGGAGGCGGGGGEPGLSGGPSIGLIIHLEDPERTPVMRDLTLETGIAGMGGRGGQGGDGGMGSNGGKGGGLTADERNIPPLAGATDGANGGMGGNGGRGGGGGGGCGGSVVGIWIISAHPNSPLLEEVLAQQTTFIIGTVGQGGAKGFGGNSGSAGKNGEVHHVLVR